MKSYNKYFVSSNIERVLKRFNPIEKKMTKSKRVRCRREMPQETVSRNLWFKFNVFFGMGYWTNAKDNKPWSRLIQFKSIAYFVRNHTDRVHRPFQPPIATKRLGGLVKHGVEATVLQLSKPLAQKWKQLRLRGCQDSWISRIKSDGYYGTPTGRTVFSILLSRSGAFWHDGICHRHDTLPWIPSSSLWDLGCCLTDRPQPQYCQTQKWKISLYLHWIPKERGLLRFRDSLLCAQCLFDKPVANRCPSYRYIGCSLPQAQSHSELLRTYFSFTKSAGLVDSVLLLLVASHLNVKIESYLGTAFVLILKF